MLLAYVDESGNTGSVAAGGTLTYTLGCVIVDSVAWAATFDQMLTFRRRLKVRFEIPMRAELKANYLLRGNGSLLPLHLPPGERFLIYRAHMRQLAPMQARVFAVVVDKRSPGNEEQCFDLAWEGLLQRLERTFRHPPQDFSIVHDEGENDAIRKWARRARRYLPAGSAFSGGQLQAAASMLVDDPIPRQSHHSYFVQMADLVAHAGFRAWIPPPARADAVCPQAMWDEAGNAILTATTGLRPRSRPGVVIR